MDPAASRVAMRFLSKARTYDQAKSEILDFLSHKGWVVARGLKVPHATSPDKAVRLWFRPQAIYFTTKSNLSNYGAARSFWAQDLRNKTPEQFYHEVEHAMRPGGWFEKVEEDR